ncbi:unnamed protein product, partial [Prunus brigantina]
YALRFTCLADWGLKVDVVVFCFLDLASNYEPPDSLAEWLEAGEQPVYIGFDSLRSVINRGWDGLGNLAEPSDSVYLVDNCPHDWLFQRCSAVVHHGGVGTTAAGLKAALLRARILCSFSCPTTIVPFFGDQPFWGERVHARGVGPAPIPADEFSLEKLVDAIRFMLDPKMIQGSFLVCQKKPSRWFFILRHTLQFGIGLHHAGLNDKDRSLDTD